MGRRRLLKHSPPQSAATLGSDVFFCRRSDDGMLLKLMPLRAYDYVKEDLQRCSGVQQPCIAEEEECVM